MISGRWERLLTLVFPHKCFCCAKVLAGTGYLCEDCMQALPLTCKELCRFCGKKQEECICSEQPPYQGATAPFYYTKGVPYGIHRFKYDGRSYYAAFLGDYMARKVCEVLPNAGFDCIVYVPMHHKKQHQRGFCQTKLLAERLSSQLSVPIRADILRHTGKGGAQMEQKGGAARQENARISYTCCKAATLNGERVLLVDDVLTTGWTVRRCAELLLKKGASEVYVVTAATTCMHSMYD